MTTVNNINLKLDANFDTNEDNTLSHDEIDKNLFENEGEKTLKIKDAYVNKLKNDWVSVKKNQTPEQIKYFHDRIKELEQAKDKYESRFSLFTKQVKEKVSALNNCLNQIQDIKQIVEKKVIEMKIDKIKIKEKATQKYTNKDSSEITKEYDVFIWQDNRWYYLEIDDDGGNTFIYFWKECPNPAQITKALELYWNDSNIWWMFEEKYNFNNTANRLENIDIKKEKRKEKQEKEAQKREEEVKRVTEEQLNKIDSNKVFDVLCDYDNSWEVDEKDVSKFDGKILLDTLNKYDSLYPTKLFESISYILLWDVTSIKNKKDLYNNLKSNPSLKWRFIQEISRFNNLVNALTWWKDALKKDIFEQQKLEKDNEFKKAWEIKYDELLKNYETKVSEMSWDEKTKAIQILEFLKKNENKTSFINNFRLQWMWLAISLIEQNRWAWIWASITNDSLNDNISIITKGIIDNASVNIWVWLFDWKLSPWIWVNFKLKDLKIGESTKIHSNVWLFMLIPYAAVWLTHTINTSELKNLWFEDNAIESKNIWATVNVSTLWGGVIVNYNESFEWWLEKTEQSLKTKFDTFFELKNNQSWQEYISSIRTKLGTDKDITIEDKEGFVKIINNVDILLKKYDFDSFDNDWKKLIIENIKDQYISEWKRKSVLVREQEWWKLSWLALWIQFIAGFVPLPLVGISFENIAALYKKSDITKFQEKFSLFSSNDKNNNEYIKVDKDMDELVNKLNTIFKQQWLNITKINNWLIQISWDLDKANIFIAPNVLNQVNYDNDSKKLTLWNVWNIGHKFINNKEDYLIIWATDLIPCHKLNLTEISNNNNLQSMMQKTEETTTQKTETLQINDNFNKEITQYINTNLYLFATLAQRYPKSYSEFAKNLNNWNYNGAKAYCINMLDKMPLWNEKSNFKEIIQNIHNKELLAYALTQLKDAMMVDKMNADKIIDNNERTKKTQEYINQIFWKNKKINWIEKTKIETITTELLENTSNWKKHEKTLARLMSYQEDQSIDSNYAKKLYALLMPNSVLMNENFLWIKWTNREAAFGRMISKIWGLDNNEIQTKRTALTNKLKDNSNWNQKPDSSIFAFVASYKIDKDWRQLWYRDFDTIPPWLATVADWNTQNIDEDKNKKWILNKIIKSWEFYNNIEQSLINLIKTSLNDQSINIESPQIKDILGWKTININWNNIKLNSKFLMFMYGRCGNESLWMKLESLEITWKTTKTVWWLTFNSSWYIGWNEVFIKTTNAYIWAIWWAKKEEPWQKSDWSWGSTPTTIDKWDTNWRWNTTWSDQNWWNTIWWFKP